MDHRHRFLWKIYQESIERGDPYQTFVKRFQMAATEVELALLQNVLTEKAYRTRLILRD